jgi:hypothetical protein
MSIPNGEDNYQTYRSALVQLENDRETARKSINTLDHQEQNVLWCHNRIQAFLQEVTGTWMGGDQDIDDLKMLSAFDQELTAITNKARADINDQREQLAYSLRQMQAKEETLIHDYQKTLDHTKEETEKSQ